MPERKPRSQAQRDAQLTAMEAARAAAFRRSEEKRRRAREQADRDREREAAEAVEREARGGWEVGDRITGPEATFGSERTGTVVAAPPSERGLYIQDDDGNVWKLRTHCAKAAQ